MNNEDNMYSVYLLHSDRCEPRCHVISTGNMIVWVSIFLNRTVIDSDLHFDNSCVEVIIRVKVRHITSVDGILKTLGLH